MPVVPVAAAKGPARVTATKSLSSEISISIIRYPGRRWRSAPT